MSFTLIFKDVNGQTMHETKDIEGPSENNMGPGEQTLRFLQENYEKGDLKGITSEFHTVTFVNGTNTESTFTKIDLAVIASHLPRLENA